MFIKYIKRQKGILAKLEAIILNPYWQVGSLDKRMVKFDRDNCFKEFPLNYPQTTAIHRVNSINDPEVLEEIKQLNHDIIIDFGTRIVKPPIMNIPKFGMFNVHRGILPNYRGWDSDLWAIYHGRYDLIGPTIHYITDNLDLGDIVAQGKYILHKHDRLYEMRFHTTDMAADLVLQLLRKIERGEPLLRKPQKPEDGRMFSFMPVILRLYTTAKFYLYDRKIAERKVSTYLQESQNAEPKIMQIRRP
jgi:methionyl-tRNA formyltransferase